MFSRMLLLVVLLCFGLGVHGQDSPKVNDAEGSDLTERRELASLFKGFQELTKTWSDYDLSSKIDVSQIRKEELLSSHQFRLRQVVDRSREEVFVVRELRLTKPIGSQKSYSLFALLLKDGHLTTFEAPDNVKSFGKASVEDALNRKFVLDIGMIGVANFPSYKSSDTRVSDLLARTFDTDADVEINSSGNLINVTVTRTHTAPSTDDSVLEETIWKFDKRYQVPTFGSFKRGVNGPLHTVTETRVVWDDVLERRLPTNVIAEGMMFVPIDGKMHIGKRYTDSELRWNSFGDVSFEFPKEMPRMEKLLKYLD